jgi:hypothetical protein
MLATSFASKRREAEAGDEAKTVRVQQTRNKFCGSEKPPVISLMKPIIIVCGKKGSATQPRIFLPPK